MELYRLRLEFSDQGWEKYTLYQMTKFMMNVVKTSLAASHIKATNMLRH